MERRKFIKITSAAACATVLLPSVGSLLTGCSDSVDEEETSCSSSIAKGSWDFDEIVDRSGTWSIKMN